MVSIQTVTYLLDWLLGDEQSVFFLLEHTLKDNLEYEVEYCGNHRYHKRNRDGYFRKV